MEFSNPYVAAALGVIVFGVVIWILFVEEDLF